MTRFAYSPLLAEDDLNELKRVAISTALQTYLDFSTSPGLKIIFRAMHFLKIRCTTRQERESGVFNSLDQD